MNHCLLISKDSIDHGENCVFARFMLDSCLVRSCHSIVFYRTYNLFVFTREAFNNYRAFQKKVLGKSKGPSFGGH